MHEGWYAIQGKATPFRFQINYSQSVTAQICRAISLDVYYTAQLKSGKDNCWRMVMWKQWIGAEAAVFQIIFKYTQT